MSSSCRIDFTGQQGGLCVSEPIRLSRTQPAALWKNFQSHMACRPMVEETSQLLLLKCSKHSQKLGGIWTQPITSSSKIGWNLNAIIIYLPQFIPPTVFHNLVIFDIVINIIIRRQIKENYLHTLIKDLHSMLHALAGSRQWRVVPAASLSEIRTVLRTYIV